LHSHKPLSATKLLRDSNKNLDHLLGGIGVIEWMNENILLHTSNVAEYLGGVCVILILKA
jgi:hypothetical protein